MSNKAKIKGCTYERELVKQFKNYGMEAKRAWGSNGQSLGHHEEVDIVVEFLKKGPGEGLDENGDKVVYLYKDSFKIQAKRRKAIPKFLGLTDNVDAVVFREDNGESYIMMPLDTFISRIRND